MPKQFYSLVLCLSTVLIVFSSCQKNSNDIISNQQNLEGTWSITGISSDRSYDFNGDGRSETNIYGTYSYCQQDIVLVFTANGGGQIRQGCNASWQNINWRFTNNSRSLVISLPGDELNLSLSQFDDYTIRGTDPVYLDGNNFNVTYTFQRR
ncbi:MAG TPA: hypothetical protein VM884_10520 [Flavisolibacter sp.]|nr:hypothetical protein [Flavisolibacter sp.]